MPRLDASQEFYFSFGALLATLIAGAPLPCLIARHFAMPFRWDLADDAITIRRMVLHLRAEEEKMRYFGRVAEADY